MIAFGGLGPVTDVSVPATLGRNASAASSEERAAAKAAEVAETKIRETLGRDHTIARSDGSTEIVRALQVDGRQLDLGALQRRSFEVRRQVTKIEAGRTTAEFPSRVDAWVSVWERTGVAVPGWPGTANLEVVVMIEDGTDRVLGVDVVLYDPRAPIQPPARDSETSCVPTPGFGGDTKLCYGSSNE